MEPEQAIRRLEKEIDYMESVKKTLNKKMDNMIANVKKIRFDMRFR